MAPHVEETENVLAAIGVEIASKRDEAKAARKDIEGTWLDCEEAYIGIDDANRHEFTDGRWSKPMAMNGPVTTGSRSANPDHKSTLFTRLTSRYVDAGAAKLGEILLPADDKAFSFSETPVPELIEASEDESQVMHAETGELMTRPPALGEPAPADAQGAPQRVPLLVKDLAIEKIELARKRAKAAETRIYDWMVECQYRAEVHKVIHDAARIGVGVLKGPVPQAKRVMAYKTTEAGGEVIIKDKIAPGAVWVDPWNVYPDPSCGENIHDGSYIFECDDMSPRRVRRLKKLPGYIGAQIDKVLEEGPNKSYADNDGRRSEAKQKDPFKIWYFHGTLTREQMCAINQAADNEPLEGDTEEVYVIATLINDTVVRATINPLDSGSFPYHSMPWQRRSKSWAGVGVAEQMKTPQRITNAAVRALLNNAGKSADNQYVIDRSVIEPMDGNWTVTPGKFWEMLETGKDVRQVFTAIQIPNTTDQMMKIIELGERFAEETTSIPLITQGQSGATTPDTFGAAQLQNNNANQLLRSIGYAFDDCITEPFIRQCYEYLLLDPEVPNEEKGEFQIDAHGSIALVERAIQNQVIGQMLAVSANPLYGLDPKKTMAEYLKAQKLNPASMQYTKEEQKKLDEAPPPEAPAITVAKINADVAMKTLVAGQTSDQQSLAAETQIKQAAQTLEGSLAHVDATVELHKEQLAHERALLDYANRHEITLEQVKGDLATTAMRLQTERDLNAANTAADLHKHAVDKSVDLHKHRNPSPKPPVQVPGRARNGRAFSQASA